MSREGIICFLDFAWLMLGGFSLRRLPGPSYAFKIWLVLTVLFLLILECFCFDSVLPVEFLANSSSATSNLVLLDGSSLATDWNKSRFCLFWTNIIIRSARLTREIIAILGFLPLTFYYLACC